MDLSVRRLLLAEGRKAFEYLSDLKRAYSAFSPDYDQDLSNERALAPDLPDAPALMLRGAAANEGAIIVDEGAAEVDYAAVWRYASAEPRLTLRPIPAPFENLYADYYLRIQKLHWIVAEVDVSKDAQDWARLPEETRAVVRAQLAFFVVADNVVFDNVNMNFLRELPPNYQEARLFYAEQAAQEGIHMDAYGIQVQAILPDKEEQRRVFDAVHTSPALAALMAWARTWFASGAPVGERLVASAAVEGIMFCASFAVLFWLRQQNVLPGVTNFNLFIARDEDLHARFACMLVRDHLRAPPSRERVLEIFESAVAAVDLFVDEFLPAPQKLPSLGGAAEMRAYVRCQADYVLGLLGEAPHWRAENPYPFMEAAPLHSGSIKNFFEGHSTVYGAVADPNFCLPPPRARA
jgi:ribonucleotide reductase beta subunit family protein with ferritin-like domain